MNAYAKRSRIAVALLAVVMMFSATAVLIADDSEANSANLASLSTSDFYGGKNGTITVPVTIDSGDCALTISVYEYDLDNPIAERSITANTGTTSISISFALSTGTHHLTVKVSDGTLLGQSTIEVDVKEDIWSNVGTYLALVVIAIVVIVIVVVYMRAKPNNKPTTTFTQLEAEKKAASAAPEKEKSAPKTEKVKYTSSRRK
ncbi:MAG: hypothetical protein J5707_02175 [Candidatus Methanomethylophilus sp.]|nr:hypothetical protein [Methanomethylophilus sp.]